MKLPKNALIHSVQESISYEMLVQVYDLQEYEKFLKNFLRRKLTQELPDDRVIVHWRWVEWEDKFRYQFILLHQAISLPFDDVNRALELLAEEEARIEALKPESEKSEQTDHQSTTS